MPVDLREQLSEYSFGYGATREFEELLASAGIFATPYFPNLRQERHLGFDVGWRLKGTALLLQFKLGQKLTRYRPSQNEQAPVLDRPFWRFGLNTAEPQGQYDLLVKADQSKARAFYVAPRFSRWNEYVHLFEARGVLRRSLILRPSHIEAGLFSVNAPLGWHHVIYDRVSAYVRSDPVPIEETPLGEIINVVQDAIDGASTLSASLESVYQSLRVVRPYHDTDVEATGGSMNTSRFIRSRRIQRYALTPDEALLDAVGLEAWSIGSQLFTVHN